jgi:casein kinase 1
MVKTVNTPLRDRTPALPRNEMEEILKKLKKLDLGVQPVLGDRTNVERAIRMAEKDAQVDSLRKLHPQKVAGNGEEDVIFISSGSDGEDPAPIRYQLPKAVQLNRLTDRASNSSENTSLAAIVREFLVIMKMNSSRTLTKDAFAFLDVLFKQLDDPSVLVGPTKYTGFSF